MDDFVNWINQELETRGWQYADIARHGGISKSMISRVISGQSKPGLDSCLAIARAFTISPEVVLRRAGLLPPLPPAVEEEGEVLRILRRISSLLQAAGVQVHIQNGEVSLLNLTV